LSLRQSHKNKHLTEDPSTKSTTVYDDWVASDCSVMMCLLNDMDEKANAGVMFLKAANEIWDTLKEMYSNEQNISWVADLYESILIVTRWSPSD